MIVSKLYEINRLPQHLYIHLAEKPRATLFFLHGGPGWADSPWAGLICKRIWSDFNTIHWDQRGCLRSYDPKWETHQLTLDQLVEDGIEVARKLISEFELDKLVLVGHSWGSMLGYLMGLRAPDYFKKLIGVGQLASNQLSEPISLEYCREKAIHTNRPELLRELQKMDSRFFQDIPTLFRQREILYELGGEFFTPTSIEQFKQWMTLGPKEFHGDWEMLYKSCEFSMHSIWQEVIKTDLFSINKPIELPVTVFQGRHDFVTASSIAEKWVQELKTTKSKNLIWFERSAHWPQIEENEKFSQLLRDEL